MTPIPPMICLRPSNPQLFTCTIATHTAHLIRLTEPTVPPAKTLSRPESSQNPYDSTIQNRPIQRFTIQRSNDPTIQQSNNPTIQQSNNPNRSPKSNLAVKNPTQSKPVQPCPTCIFHFFSRSSLVSAWSCALPLLPNGRRGAGRGGRFLVDLWVGGRFAAHGWCERFRSGLRTLSTLIHASNVFVSLAHSCGLPLPQKEWCKSHNYPKP